MLKLLLLLALIPTAIGFLIWKLLVKPTLHGLKQAPMNTHEVLTRVLPRTITLASGNEMRLKNNTLSLPASVADSFYYRDLAEPLLQSSLLITGSPTLWRQHHLALLIDHLLPSFALVLILLGALSKGIPMPLLPHTLLVTISLCSMNALYLTYLRAKGLKVALTIAKKVIFREKKSELPLFEECLKSLCFSHTLPKFITLLISRAQRTKQAP